MTIGIDATTLRENERAHRAERDAHFNLIVQQRDAAITRAERAETALREVMEWISNWNPEFEQDGEWPVTRDKVNAALAEVPP